jgi:hypothetical protein
MTTKQFDRKARLRNGLVVQFAKYSREALGEFCYLGIIPGVFDFAGTPVNGQLASWDEAGGFSYAPPHPLDMVLELPA